MYDTILFYVLLWGHEDMTRELLKACRFESHLFLWLSQAKLQRDGLLT